MTDDNRETPEKQEKEAPVPQFSDRLKEPFRRHLIEQNLLDGGIEQLEENKHLLSEWPDRKKKFLHTIVKPLQRWSSALNIMGRPLNLKRYKKEKRRLKLTGYPALYNWSFFTKKLQLMILRLLNILRILIILSVFGGALFLIGYSVAKLFG
jgi:hypothetical protein